MSLTCAVHRRQEDCYADSRRYLPASSTSLKAVVVAWWLADRRPSVAVPRSSCCRPLISVRDPMHSTVDKVEVGKVLRRRMHRIAAATVTLQAGGCLGASSQSDEGTAVVRNTPCPFPQLCSPRHRVAANSRYGHTYLSWRWRPSSFVPMGPQSREEPGPAARLKRSQVSRQAGEGKQEERKSGSGLACGGHVIGKKSALVCLLFRYLLQGR